jgi:hypothetical protein
LISAKITAGPIMPPTAASTGSAARRGSRRSPATNSRLSSSPATKKKIASRPSAAQAARLSGPISQADSDRYASPQGELAQPSPMSAAMSNSTPPTVSARSSSAMRRASGQLPRLKRGILASEGVGKIIADQTSRHTCPDLIRSPPGTPSLSRPA